VLICASQFVPKISFTVIRLASNAVASLRDHSPTDYRVLTARRRDIQGTIEIVVTSAVPPLPVGLKTIRPSLIPRKQIPRPVPRVSISPFIRSSNETSANRLADWWIRAIFFRGVFGDIRLTVMRARRAHKSRLSGCSRRTKTRTPKEEEKFARYSPSVPPIV